MPCGLMTLYVFHYEVCLITRVGNGIESRVRVRCDFLRNEDVFLAESVDTMGYLWEMG